VKDFDGIVPFLSKSCVVAIHDVDAAQMYEGFGLIEEKARRLGFDGFIAATRFTAFGTGLAIRSVASLAQDIDSLPHFAVRRMARDKKVAWFRLNDWILDVDTNHDLRVTREEFAADAAKHPAKKNAAEVSFDQILKPADKDGDGVLGAVEALETFELRDHIEFAKTRFRHLDQNQDGVWERREHTARARSEAERARLEREFDLFCAQADENKDGRLSGSEMMHAYAAE
jgi:Ca2+-binding EF-hand superfamily protein